MHTAMTGSFIDVGNHDTDYALALWSYTYTIGQQMIQTGKSSVILYDWKEFQP